MEAKILHYFYLYVHARYDSVRDLQGGPLHETNQVNTKYWHTRFTGNEHNNKGNIFLKRPAT